MIAASLRLTGDVDMTPVLGCAGKCVGTYCRRRGGTLTRSTLLQLLGLQLLGLQMLGLQMLGLQLIGLQLLGLQLPGTIPAGNPAQ